MKDEPRARVPHLEADGPPPEETELLARDAGPRLKKREAHLVMVCGPKVGEMFALTAESTTIGRDQRATIRIDDPNVSRLHARIVRRANAFWLEDLGSANGSFVNEHRIKGQQLDEGDKISIGSTTILRFASYDDLDESYQRRVRESILMDGFYRALFSGSPAPSFVVDEKTDGILLANTAAVTTYGYMEAELARMRFADLAVDAPQPAEGTCAIAARHRRKDGALLEVELTTQRLSLFDRGARLVIANDLTERRRIELRLRLADRMATIGTLAAGIAHEINNPLAYVAANVQFAREALESGPDGTPEEHLQEALTALADAADGSERIRRIVRSLKSFSAADDSNREVVDVHEALEGAVAIAMNEIRHRARIVKSYCETTLSVRGYSGRLGQVFLNLLVNAAQAIPEGDVASNEIRIVTGAEDNGVFVEVHDTGKGIPPPAREHVFDTFFTTKPGGTGLGLSICQNIVGLHGGHIEFTSEVGKGTIFRVLLPRHAEDRRDAAAARIAGDPVGDPV